MRQSLESAALEIGIDVCEIDLHCIGIEQRFPTLAKRHKNNGGATVHPSGAVCLHNWESGERLTWRPDSVRRAPSDEERHERAQQVRANLEARERHQQQQWADAAEIARQMWRSAKPATADHPYLARKRLPPFDLGRADCVNGVAGDWLTAPLYDRDMRVGNLECINADGDKRPIRGAQRKGLFGLVGDGMPIDHNIIVEGWATGAALAVSLSCCVIVAFGKSNLKATALLWNQLNPRGRMTIAADNDPDGGGWREAGAAADALGAVGVETNIKMPGTAGDWCDLFTKYGAEIVCGAWIRG